jgi:DNA-directed RNA polymerase subunit RPC12/RpoP
MAPPPFDTPDSIEKLNYENLVRDGVTAAKNGNRSLARRLLEQALQLNPVDSHVWLWLSAATEDLREQRTFLERAVAADPSNSAARRGLVMISEKLDKSRLMPEGVGIAPTQSIKPEEAQSEAYQCPNCGGRMSFDVGEGDLVCQSCGHHIEVVQHLPPDSAERPLDFIIPTTRAHCWAESQQSVACEQCGAITLLPPGQTTDYCSYCGMNRFVMSTTLTELVDPQVIVVFRIELAEAEKRVKAWFRKGMFAPDNLMARASRLQLRPAYIPFWIFDGTLEMPWSCEVNEGNIRNPRWVARNGSEIEFFNDVLVPGLRSMTLEEQVSIEPFNMKDLVEFSPDYLAGWTSLTYDYALADASLRGRELVVHKISRFLPARVELGHEKRSFSTGAGKWSGMTFKHTLLPLYIGTYTFQGKPYRMLVNGQTGKVGGKKPRDNVKVILVGLLGLVGLVLIIGLLQMLLK